MSVTSLSRLQSFYGDLEPLPLLRTMIGREFQGRISALTSFGADAALMLSLIAEVDPATPVLFLETGKHFPETLDYARRLEKHLGLTDVRWLTPDEEMLNRIDPKGELWQLQPNRCCWLRKVEPLNRALKDYGIEALITGRKRYQTKDRENMGVLELDENGIFRINPLAYWTREQAQAEFTRRRLPEHPLVSRGYKSIGCAPCTLPVGASDSERAGRWSHTAGLMDQQKVECGIHGPYNSDWSV